PALGVRHDALVGGRAGLYAVPGIVGFIYAGTMPLYAVIIRGNFPLRRMGTIIGAMAMAGSLGMSTGPVLGGLLFDNFGTYAPMYVASFGLGLVAMLVLAMFRPFPARAPGLAPA